MKKSLLLPLFFVIGACTVSHKIYATATVENQSEQQGLYFVVEGIEGCGKSTFIKNITQALQELSTLIVATKEPGGSALGLEIRKILEHRTAPTCPLAESLLFAADRAQHFAEKVLPLLEQQYIIISDRSYISALAYQGYLKSVNKEMISMINAWAMHNRTPDIIFYLRLEPEIATKRAINRNEVNKFEAEILPRMQTLHEAFDEILKTEENVVIIDAAQTPDAMLEQAIKALQIKFPHLFFAQTPTSFTSPEQLHEQ